MYESLSGREFKFTFHPCPILHLALFTVSGSGFVYAILFDLKECAHLLAIFSLMVIVVVQLFNGTIGGLFFFIFDTGVS